MTRIAAFATDDGTDFIDRHFGDAAGYDLYEIGEGGFRFLKRLPNDLPPEEDGVHADPRKAGGIASLLQQENVTVAVARVFGGNLKRIRRKFVCVVLDQGDVPGAVILLKSRLARLEEEWARGEERGFLRGSDLEQVP